MINKCRCNRCNNRRWQSAHYGEEQVCIKTDNYISTYMMNGITPKFCPLKPKMNK